MGQSGFVLRQRGQDGALHRYVARFVCAFVMCFVWQSEIKFHFASFSGQFHTETLHLTDASKCYKKVDPGTCCFTFDAFVVHAMKLYDAELFLLSKS